MEISEEQIQIIRDALDKAKHKGYEDCSAEVCEMITKAVKELDNLVKKDSGLGNSE